MDAVCFSPSMGGLVDSNLVGVFPWILERDVDQKKPVLIIGLGFFDLDRAAESSAGNVFNITFVRFEIKAVIVQFQVDVLFSDTGNGEFQVQGGTLIVNAGAEIC